ncbi:hypothetical protein [Pseudooceanicola sp. HF7]|uniref:hypothetical protein n=1 Tax=Pseudooceanicola sp. HF7 TaxID=2721560 RepID=UPI00142FEB01|nr:hypothetical protein [Pseudooceanicola sp. HF7]NIZ10170.1 hypothetical protein [Pseudooceanicola sp. HF7]
MLLPVNPRPSDETRALVARVQREREAAFAASDPEPTSGAKPGWAKRASRKAPFVPERDKPGTRFAAPVPRGQGPAKRWSTR